MKIYPLKGHALTESERLALAQLLVKAGYSVRIVKEKLGGAKQPTVGIEYWVWGADDENSG